MTETWTYGINEQFGSGSITSPDGGTTSQSFVVGGSAGCASWNCGLVYLTVNPDGSKVEKIWAQNHISGFGADNPYVKTEFTSIKNAAGSYVKTAIKDYSYDKNGNVTRVAEYDWLDYASVPRTSGMPTGIPYGAMPFRVTTNTYYNATADASQSPTGDGNVYWYQSSPLWKNAIAAGEIADGSGNIKSRTEFSYDNYSSTGNVTQKRSWDSSKGAYSNLLMTSNSISVSSQYTTWSNGNTGKLTQTTDAKGAVTALTYGSVGGFDIYPTQIVSASGTAIARTETRAYHFATGLVTSVTDTDNNVTTSTTYDAFGRATLVASAVGKPEETRTSTEYSDIARRVIVRSDLNTLGDGKLVSIQHYDQLGRIRLARQLEDSTTQSAYDETLGIKVQTRYAFSGANSYVLTSNPYRAAVSSDSGGESTMGWTRSKSDNTGRMVEVQTFGGSSLPAPWDTNSTSTGTVTTSYDANFTTVTDQAGKVRRSLTDGLGRLARVDEPDGSGNLGATTSPVQPTSYDYDVFGNLLHVYQGTQTRTFTYDSLSRLRTTQNPESGTITYAYDDNGNLTSKTDARSITTNYVYDALNRVTSRSYQNDPNSTPAVTYTYDSAPGVSNARGRLVSVSSSVSNYSYGGYDALGKMLSATQTMYGQTTQSYTVNYNNYDLAGHVRTMTYPSGRQVTNSYDNAGRLQSFNGNLGGTQKTYASDIIYDAGGRMTQEQFGTNTAIFNKLFYNSRGQLAEIREGVNANDTGWERGAIINHYSNNCWGMCSGSSMPDDNGNLQKQDVYIPGVSTAFSQFYSYDSLNRLQSVREDNVNGSANWKQSYIYDRYGNRTVDQNAVNTYGTGIPKPNFDLETTTNRLLGAGDLGLGEASRSMRYDAAGNLWKDTYSGAAVTRLYDGENRMTKETQASSYVAGEYSYDGDGRRVKRSVGGVETWQVYGIGGELIAEYAANATASSPQKEYGYRNGQLLITATVTSGWGTAPTFNDNPLQVGVTTVQARHITELRTAIDAVRSHYNLAAYSWTTSATTNDYISANPIQEMRTGLDQALGAGSYAVGLASGQPVKAVHIQELRDRILAAWQSGGGVDIRWLVSDQLGTPRMIFDQSGSLATTSRHDYLPFGEELTTQGGRSPQLGYVGDSTRQKFTGYEHDNETGLDYAKARFFGASLGRFNSPDPLFASAKSWNPQSWNRYTYCLNNPLKFTDPTGLIWVYQWLDKKHTQIGVGWANSEKSIPKGYQVLPVPRNVTLVLKLAGGRQLALLRSDSPLAQLVSVTNSARTTNGGGVPNPGLLRELSKQTGPMPQAVGLFVGVSVIGGSLAVSSPMNATAYVAYALYDRKRNDAQVAASTRISMDDAIDKAVDHVGSNGNLEVTPGGNFQFRSTGINSNGQVESRMGRLDINPADPHVIRNGPHLNLETHINGRPVGIDPHTPIDPATILPGDIP